MAIGYKVVLQILPHLRFQNFRFRIIQIEIAEEDLLESRYGHLRAKKIKVLKILSQDGFDKLGKMHPLFVNFVNGETVSYEVKKEALAIGEGKGVGIYYFDNEKEALDYGRDYIKFFRKPGANLEISEYGLRKRK